MNASSSAVEITDANSISLGDIDATGDLVVNALAGSIDDGVSGLAGEDVNVGGAAAFNAVVHRYIPVAKTPTNPLAAAISVGPHCTRQKQPTRLKGYLIVLKSHP